MYFGILFYVLWNIILCTLEYYFMYFGILFYVLWNIILCTLEY